ncbi:MAG: YiiX/YebB-like N1pC/P60 family cysteine hydrolase [Ferruginibacter sp.]
MRESCLRKNKLNIKIFKIRWLVIGCLIFLFASCDNINASSIKSFTSDHVAEKIRFKEAVDSIKVLSPLIKNGDLITRTGNDFTSESLRSLNRRDKKYSHCGIAIIENESVYIYHALGGDFNPNQKLLRESLLTFADPSANRGIGLFRFNSSALINDKLSQIVHQHFKEGLPFDMDFDLSTDNKMYCAEFVVKSYISASNNILNFNKSKIEKFTFYGVDDVFLNPFCIPIKELTYKQ